jgi:outer membrane receptor protein involved in Fe transport
MHYSSKSRSALRHGVAPLALLWATTATAQAADVPASSDNPEVGTIVVTGSRLSRIDLDSASPVSLVSSQEIQLKGAVNVDEFLNDMPQSYPIQNGQSNNPGDGSSWIDLRGLGAERTLVLVNGRRWMPYDVTQIVLLNTIPAQLIDRTEILTGGRSAVYGSDAIAGVVHIVLKKDFDGVAVDSQYRITGKGDGGTWGTSVILGGNFNEGRGNATVYIDYTKREAIMADERSFSRRTISDDGEGGFYYGGSGSIPGGRANWGNGLKLFLSDGSFRPYSSPPDAYNFAPDN